MGSLGPADVAWFEEIERAMLAALELAARLDCLLSQLRFADFATFRARAEQINCSNCVSLLYAQAKRKRARALRHADSWARD